MNKDYLKNFQLNFYQDIFTFLKKENYPYSIRSYRKQQLIALANTKCISVGIIISGNADIEHVLYDGKKVTIQNLKPYDIFGEILIFSEESLYPYNIIAYTNCDILFITKEILLKIFVENKILLEKFLYHTSQSYLNLNRYIKLKTQKTIVSKLAFYFIHYAKLNDETLTCKIKTKTYLAEFLGVERQSLIRELNRLKGLNLIDYDKNNIYVQELLYFKKLVE